MHVPYDGGPLDDGTPAPSIVSVIQQWRGFDGCGATAQQSHSGITDTSIWACKSGTVVQLDTVVGGHHTWFGSKFDSAPGEPDANSLVWDFFTRVTAGN